MTFEKQLHQTCPKCKDSSIYTISTTTSRDATRRRKKCKSCGYRETTHEVSDEFFQKAKDNSLALKRIHDALSIVHAVEEKQVQEIPCFTCVHNGKFGCTFDFPESGTLDAIDCTHFTKN